MARIFYFTTAQDKKLFKTYLEHWRYPPNLSNQNFHNKLIRCLALNNDVEALSIRPINSNFQSKELNKQVTEDRNIIWHHIKVVNSRIDKLFFVANRINVELANIKKSDKEVVIVDTMNMNLLKQAYRFARKRGIKIIGVCTDNPNNISFTSESYKKKLVDLGKKLDGYIVLTSKINELYNDSKPFIQIDGVNEEYPEKKNDNAEKYIFFGGSLMRKYGVYSLIDAFKMLNNPDIKLYLCGHHEENDLISSIKDNPNILYFGALDNDKIRELEVNALLGINPRPVDPEIDEYSIPSKTLEYLANGVLTISVENKLLEKKYKDAIVWAKSGDQIDLLDAINAALNMSEKEKKRKIALGEELINKYTSFEVVNKEINDLIAKMLID